MSLSYHCKIRMSQRSIKFWEVKRAILNGVKVKQDNGTLRCEYRGITSIYDEGREMVVSTWRDVTVS